METGLLLLDYIGFFGPLLLFCVSVWKLSGRISFLYGYIGLFLGSTLINKALKLVFKEPRPEGSRTIIGEPYQGADEYGMPSGHAQSVTFSMTYLYLVTQNALWLALELCVGCLTLSQRWKYKNHSVSQLTVGALVGFFLGYYGYQLTNQWIQKKQSITTNI
jgi:membrane-associated phospholipid phosphatase